MLTLLGHQTVYRELVALSRQAQAGRGLLVTGNEGIGKRALAEYWTAQRFCQAPRPQGEWVAPCGQCDACIQIARGHAPDYHVIAPSDTGIAIQKIRDAKAWAALTAFYGKGKVLLIDDAHTMQKPAANALLKLLEEPAAALFIVLVTAQPAALPVTIRSRCLTFRCQPPTWDAAVAAFVSARQPEIDLALARRWFRIWQGGIGLVIATPLAEWETLRRMLFDVVVAATGDAARIASVVAALKPFKRRMGLVFDLLASLLCDLAARAAGLQRHWCTRICSPPMATRGR